MRTTIRIDDELYRAVKERAARTGRTVGELVEDAVRRLLSTGEAQGPDPLPSLPVYGGSGVVPGVDLTSGASLRELMDEDVPARALR